jgi:hypothetical protein
MGMIKDFMKENGLNEDSLMDSKTKPLIVSILDRLSKAKLRGDATILVIFTNLQLALEESQSTEQQGDHSTNQHIRNNSSTYSTSKLVNEILDDGMESPKLFVIVLPEADVARYFCAEIIERVFWKRKNSFTLPPRVVFVFDDARRNSSLRRKEGKMGQIAQVVL